MSSPTPRKIKCLSCEVDPECQYVDAKFSPNGKYYILECLGPAFPQYQLRDVKDNSLIEVLDDNSRLKEWSKERAFPKIRYLSVPINDGLYSVRVKLTLPFDLEEEEDVKFPSVVHMYVIKY